MSIDWIILRTQLFQAEPLTASELNTADFWRLSLGNNNHNLLVMSSKDVVHFDSRVAMAIKITLHHTNAVEE